MYYSDKNIIFCLAGHCNNEDKTLQAITIINHIKLHYPNELISFCSHTPIDLRIQKLTHYTVYDSNNIISNVNYIDNLSLLYKQTFWNIPRHGYHIIKSIPHQCFAHHLNWYSQSKLIQDKKINYIFYLNTDCDLKIFDTIDQHIELHNEGYDAVFYNYRVGDEEMNGEYFSMTKKGMQDIVLNIESFSDFYSYGTWSFEQCYFRVAKHHNVKTKYLGVWEHDNGIIGKNTFVASSNEEEIGILNASHYPAIIPFMDYLDNYVLKIIVLINDASVNFEGCTITLEYYNLNNQKSDTIDSLFLHNNCWSTVIPPGNFTIVRVYRDNNFLFSFDLSDRRNIGDMIREDEINNYNINLKG
jgi:hypothetical protein